MSGSWPDRVAAIGESLLTLEINTVVTNTISAQKLPEIPLALHTLVQVYNDYLANVGFQVTNALLTQAAIRVCGVGEAATNEGARLMLLQLQRWHPEGRRWTAGEIKAGLPGISDACLDASGPAAELTNGAETFEALQWAAWAAIQTHLALGATVAADLFPMGGVDPSVLSRIYANCRQLKEAALRLEQQNHGVDTDPTQPPPALAPARKFGWKFGFRDVAAAAAQPGVAKLLVAGSKIRLAGCATGARPQPAAPTTPRLFGATVEETARALFAHPRPTFDADPDVTMLIRKAWDLGVQRVCLQTVLQVDGDLTEIIAEPQGDDRAFLTDLHRQAVKDAVSQWRSFWDVLLQLAGDLGQAVFRRA
jgi:hypothetical protein